LPVGNGSVPIDPNTSPYAAALQNAFALAPGEFQNRLCDLTAIFINGPESCNTIACLGSSWGYRSFRTGQEYVAISAGLWNLGCPDGSAYAYHCFETDLLNTTVNWRGVNSFPPQYSKANPEADNFDMTVLAALAHEVGHVRWYDIFNPDHPGQGYNPNNSTFCDGGFFANSWTSPIHKPAQWRGLGDRNQGNGAPDRHLNPPQISMIDRAIRTGDVPTVLMYLDELYQPDALQPWASYLGAISPDEDFVETYKLWVLTNAQPGAVQDEGPLTSLPIIFLNGTIEDIPKTYGVPAPNNFGAPKTTGKALLAAKARCIGQSI
jgi:hypothetical protein